MGRRSGDETVGALILALMQQRSWEQAALARRLEVNVATVRRHLRHLQAHDPSITATIEPPQVVWRVPKGWAPGALPLGTEGARALFHLLARTPGSMRNELLGRVVAMLPQPTLVDRATRVVVVPELSEAEERAFSVFVDAAALRRAVRIRYRSLGAGGEAEPRDVSPQRILAGSVFYLLAKCHRDDRLKHFRLSSVDDARIATGVSYREVDGATLDAHIATSAGAFRGEQNESIVFDVRRSEL